MSMISKQIDDLRAYAKDRKGELAKLVSDAADTIEMLSAKLSAANNDTGTERRTMTPEQKDKYQRLDDRLAELADLNGKIGKLSFYLNENADGPDGIARDALIEQLESMDNYRDRLEYRIKKGWY